MWTFLRRESRFFSIGFIVTFIVTLFVRFDPTDILTSIAIGAAGGFLLAVVLWYLERKFPDNIDS